MFVILLVKGGFSSACCKVVDRSVNILRPDLGLDFVFCTNFAANLASDFSLNVALDFVSDFASDFA